MGTFQKGNKIGNRFTSEKQPPNRGRKPSLYKKLREITGKQIKHEMTKEDYHAIISYLMEQTPEQLKAMAGLSGDGKKSMFDAEIPVWMMSIITAIFGDIRYGRTTTLDSLFDRIFGKAKQTMESDINAQVTNNGVDLSVLTTEELLQYNMLLEKIKSGDGKK